MTDAKKKIKIKTHIIVKSINSLLQSESKKKLRNSTMPPAQTDEKYIKS